jgi:prepilin-type N-terminal cleavage/methylation domain-containing protein
MKRGFTLVEIMIVVLIITLLAAIGIPVLLRSKVNANETNAQTILKTISTACESYATANNGNYPDDISDLTDVTPQYLNEDYTSSTIQGYNFICTLTSTGYTCTATPAACGTSGTKTFTITNGAVLTSTNCS